MAPTATKEACTLNAPSASGGGEADRPTVTEPQTAPRLPTRQCLSGRATAPRTPQKSTSGEATATF
eukprot:10120998-Alexandrium_andersonii.AAC.1